MAAAVDRAPQSSGTTREPGRVRRWLILPLVTVVGVTGFLLGQASDRVIPTPKPVRVARTASPSPSSPPPTAATTGRAGTSVLGLIRLEADERGVQWVSGTGSSLSINLQAGPDLAGTLAVGVALVCIGGLDLRLTIGNQIDQSMACTGVVHSTSVRADQPTVIVGISASFTVTWSLVAFVPRT